LIRFQNKKELLQKNKITRENLYHTIKKATITLLEMAREHSWNEISNDVKFVIKKVETDILENLKPFEGNKIRKRLLNSKEELSLDKAIEQLKSEFESIYLIELYIFKVTTKQTIVEIEILEKSTLDAEYRKTILSDPPMLHCKVAIPPYIDTKSKDKFDINWQLETFEFKWKMFWHRVKRKKN